MNEPVKLFVTLVCALLTQSGAQAQVLPAAVADALARAKVPLDAVSLLVVDADGQSAPRLSHRADAPMNPASVMKLVTTSAALDLLGPSFTWRTPVWVDGKIHNGVLKGNLVIQGQGDPALVLEKLWLLLHRVQGLGIAKIDGDIVLDRSAFSVPDANPGDFDGEPLRPYNASADALLINFKSIIMTFTPDPAAELVRVQYDPPLWGVRRPTTLPLRNTPSGACGDYRGALKADFSDPTQIRFTGSYPGGCGEKVWPLAYSDPANYNARAVRGLWQDMGGQLTGSVREGKAPNASATFELVSPTLAEVIRDINKFSNNVMAEQLFLTLGRASAGIDASAANTPATPDAARAVLRLWWQQRINRPQTPIPAPTLDNGSGLSRQARISAQGLARLLQVSYASPYLSELMSSLPIVGLDGTLGRSAAANASAHLKTGSLQGVLALAGFVHASNGHSWALVALINHANASAARPAMDALVDWAANEANRPDPLIPPSQRIVP